MKTNKISGNRFGHNFLEYRRRELERFLVRVTAHPILRTSKYVQLFLETKDNSKFVSAKVDEKPKSSPGFFSRITKAMVSSGGVETDNWFAQKTEYISKLHLNLENLSNTAQVVNQHHEAGISIHTPFMESLKTMGEHELKYGNRLGDSFTRVSGIIAQMELFEHELVCIIVFMFNFASFDSFCIWKLLSLKILVEVLLMF